MRQNALRAQRFTRHSEGGPPLEIRVVAALARKCHGGVLLGEVDLTLHWPDMPRNNATAFVCGGKGRPNSMRQNALRAQRFTRDSEGGPPLEIRVVAALARKCHGGVLLGEVDLTLHWAAFGVHFAIIR